MFNHKNVGTKERIARIISGVLMIVCGLAVFHITPLGLVIAGAGVMSLVTGIIRYCPACAIVGRKSTDNC